MSVTDLSAHVNMLTSLGIKKHDKVLAYCSNLGMPENAIAISEAMGIKVTATVSNEIEVLIGEYEGNPTLSIGKKNQSGKFYPYLTLGKSKAKMIIEHLEAIKAFAN